MGYGSGDHHGPSVHCIEKKKKKKGRKREEDDRWEGATQGILP